MDLFDKAWDRAKEVKNQYDERRRAEKEDVLNVKAEELRAKEAQLKQFEDDLMKQSLALDTRERDIARKVRRPWYVFVLSVATIVLLQSYLWTNYDITAKQTPTSREVPVAAAAPVHEDDASSPVVPTPSAPIASSPSSPSASNVSSSSQSMSFDECLRTIQRFASQVGTAPNNIAETDILRIVRFQTTDGSVLVTCSRPDRKMVLTKSPYQ